MELIREVTAERGGAAWWKCDVNNRVVKERQRGARSRVVMEKQGNVRRVRQRIRQVLI